MPRSHTPIALALLVALSISFSALAETVVVTLKDGGTVEGELIDKSSRGVTIRINTIEATIVAKDIARIESKLSVRQMYKEKLAQTNTKDPKAMVELANWLLNQETKEANELALDLLQNKIMPITAEGSADRTNVQILIQVVNTRLKANQAPAWKLKYDEMAKNLRPGDVQARVNIIEFLVAQRDSAANGLARAMAGEVIKLDPNNAVAKAVLNRNTNSANPTEAKGQVEGEVFNDKQAYLLRVYEILDPLETKPRVAIPDKTMDDVWEQFREYPAMLKWVQMGRKGRAALKRAQGYEKLSLLFTLKARQFYPDVIIRDELESLKEYRLQMNHTYVSQYFHRYFGKGDFGLVLFNKNPRSLNEVYTNFYLLSTTDGPDNLPFIDRQNPQNSLLLQWGLPRQEATYPAPDVKGWKPYFTGLKDRRFIRWVKWIDGLLEPTPTYEMINFKRPIVKNAKPAKPPAKVEPTKPAGANTPAP